MTELEQSVLHELYKRRTINEELIVINPSVKKQVLAKLHILVSEYNKAIKGLLQKGYLGMSGADVYTIERNINAG